MSSRNSKNSSWRRIAKKLGVSHSHLYYVISGQRESPELKRRYEEIIGDDDSRSEIDRYLAEMSPTRAGVRSKLIAAAPDLLAACKLGVASCTPNSEEHPRLYLAWLAMRDAVKKATA